MTTTPPASPIDRDEIHRLLSAFVDGELSDADRARLEALLLNDADARAEYRDFMCLESLLAWNIAAEDQRLSARPEAGHGGLGQEAGTTRRIAAWLVPLVVGSVAAAAVALLVLAAATPVSRMPILTAEDGAVWRDGERPVRGQPIPGGSLGLVAGTAQITFPSGAIVAVHSGAEFELLGPNRLFLRGGRITPYVPPKAKGFTVISPTGEVIDFGTEFTVGVGPDGQTDVFVIDGEVDVAGGHAPGRRPVRLTQGFASRFTAAKQTPTMTQQPIVIDHFDAEAGPLHRADLDPGRPSTVADGWLRIPFGCTGAVGRCNTQVVLAENLSSLVGRVSVISFKAMLPAAPDLDPGRWLALVIDNGDGEPRMATKPGALAAVMMSPLWQAGMRFDGEVHESKHLFPRGRGTEGPYQVVLAIDDRPETRASRGGATFTLMINGLDFVRDRPVPLGPRPRIVFQTSSIAGRGVALIDDFSISADVGTP